MGQAHRLSLSVQYGVAAARLPTKETLRRWVRSAQERDLTVLVRFTGMREGRRLNTRFRGGDSATNVLTFVYDDVLPLAGNVVLCAPVLRREASAAGWTLADHCAHLVVHGMLHLQGYDHDTRRDAHRMEARETLILAGLGIPDPYSDRCAVRYDGPAHRSGPAGGECMAALPMTCRRQPR